MAGSGKTITGEILQTKLDNCARIESDFLILVKPFEPGENLTRIKIQNTATQILNFVSEKYENILVVGGAWNQTELNQFFEMLPYAECEIIIFWLNASKEERFARSLKRGDPDDNVEWLERMEKLFPTPVLPLKVLQGKSYVIETDNKPPDMVADEIVSKL